jgi:hypothetical protein
MAIYRDLIIRFRGRLQEQLLDLESSQVAVAAVAREWLKGNEPMEPSVLPPKRSQVLYAYLSDERVYGNRLLTMPSDSLIWLSFSNRNFSQAIGPRTISNICERYLGTGKVHATRHTAAVNLSHQKG